MLAQAIVFGTIGIAIFAIGYAFASLRNGGRTPPPPSTKAEADVNVIDGLVLPLPESEGWKLHPHLGAIENDGVIVRLSVDFPFVQVHGVNLNAVRSERYGKAVISAYLLRSNDEHLLKKST